MRDAERKLFLFGGNALIDHHSGPSRATLMTAIGPSSRFAEGNTQVALRAKRPFRETEYPNIRICAPERPWHRSLAQARDLNAVVPRMIGKPTTAAGSLVGDNVDAEMAPAIRVQSMGH